MSQRISAVLFDLDGTLVDSAPDLAGTLNDMRRNRGLPPWPEQRLREHCGSGARGMLGEGLQLRPDDAAYDQHRDEFLQRYAQRLLHHTRPFDGVMALLQVLDDQRLPWGIVTNKALYLAQPLCEGLALLPASGALVGGDSTPHRKPHPAPVLEAARLLGAPASQCLMVGDDVRDVAAGRAAGMLTVAAAWGYVGAGEQPQHWGADAVLQHPAEVAHWILKRRGLP